MFLIDESIKNIIVKKSIELGFIKTGFAHADILNEESENLHKWINNGYDAGMKWIQKNFEKRKDITKIMSDAKTVISLAYNYYTPFSHDEKLPKISRYAWGKDYHKIMKHKLQELCKFIEEKVNCEERIDEAIPKSGANNELASCLPVPQAFRQVLPLKIHCIYYVDDGPVMDKVWAKRAGIGWQGKHTNIISPEYGSWIFLCEIITNLDCNVYDKPIEDLCGSCRICIDVCPTGAIVDEYQLDSNLCISYQTIENKGDIPNYIDLNGWLFGCDVCQDVCPFNSNDKMTNDKSFYPKQEIFNKTKEELENITEKEFKDICKDSPVKRTKYKGWKRNLEHYNSNRKLN